LYKVTLSHKMLGNRNLIRGINRSLVLTTIKNLGPINRAEVARYTGLSPATVSGITADLIEDDLIFEKEIGDSSGGRPPILLALNPSGGYVVGIKLTESQAIGALTDLEATVLTKQTNPLAGQSSLDVIDTLTDLVHDLLRSALRPERKLLGVGVGLAGIVDSTRGVLRKSPFFGWRDLPLRDLLQEKVNTSVYVDNDVNTLTIAEKWFGAGQQVDHFLTVTIGRGVGMGIVVNGEFYNGAGGGAGEFGHIVMDPEGPPCHCGKRGCLESFVSEVGLVQTANEAYRRGQLPEPVKSIEQLLALSEQGNPSAQDIFTKAGTILGQAVANLINLFNPQRIILGGEGVRIGNALFDPMRTAIQCHVMPGLEQDTEIRIDPWGDDAWARGAASLVLREIFKSPISRKEVPVPGD
jgi:predicted NBD/HSP70 family sugar kinase